MQALILAAGRGERLRPITDTIPKPLVQLGQRRLIEYHILRLFESGITDIVINVSYKAEQIMAYLKNGERYGVNITYSMEQPAPLETGGGIKKALSYIDSDPFLVVNSDVLCNYSFSSLHVEKNFLASLVLVPNPTHNRQGDFVLSSNQVVRHITAESSRTYTFSGIGLYRQSLFAELPQTTYPLTTVLESPIRESKIMGQIFSGQWMDIGTVERLQQAQQDFLF